jgi:hypothetical protein
MNVMRMDFNYLYKELTTPKVDSWLKEDEYDYYGDDDKKKKYKEFD